MACRALLVLSLALVAQRPPEQTPPLVRGLLAGHLTWHLIDPPADLKGDDAATLAAAADRRWVIRDVDRDGRPDAAAVVVISTADGPRFGVVAVHANAPHEPHWIVPFSRDPIRGVSGGPAPDTVEPLFCIECDSNPWFRWSTVTYEPRLYAIGEAVTFVERLPGAAAVALFAEPDPYAARTAAVPSCGTARVTKVAGSPGARWYFVQLPGPAMRRGWIPATLLTQAVVCD